MIKESTVERNGLHNNKTGNSKELGGTTAMVLAGGLGTRLRSAISGCPKVLAQVQGRVFLAWLLDYLASAGIQDVLLCTGYQAGQVERTFGARYRDIQLRYSVESFPLGTGGALRHALKYPVSETLLVLNGDSFCEADLMGFSHYQQLHADKPAIVVAQAEDTGRFGRLQFNDAGRITSFVEKSRAHGSGWINAGIYLIPRALIEALPAGVNISLEREIFPQWLAAGLFAFKTDKEVVDIGTPESYRAINEPAAGFALIDRISSRIEVS